MYRQLLPGIVLWGGAACAEPEARDRVRTAECREAATDYRQGSATPLSAVRINVCEREAGAIVPRLWSRPPGDSAGLAQLMTASSGVLDPKILAAVTRAATDTTKPPNVRALATIIMGRYLDSALSGDIQRTGITGVWWAFPGSALGAEPNPPKAYATQRAEIRRRIKRIAETDPHDAVRDVAHSVLNLTVAP